MHLLKGLAVAILSVAVLVAGSAMGWVFAILSSVLGTLLLVGGFLLFVAYGIWELCTAKPKKPPDPPQE